MPQVQLPSLHAGKAAARAPEKEIERALTSGGDESDLAFDPRMVAPPSVPKVAAETSAAIANDPNLADAIANKLGEKMAQFMPNPKENILMMGEMIKQVVLALREPTAEQKQLEERKKRDRAQAIREQAEMIEARRLSQELCPHESATSDGKTHTTIAAVHNFADGVLRGICQACNKIIEPGDQEFKIVVAQHNQAVRSMYAGAGR